MLTRRELVQAAAGTAALAFLAGCAGDGGRPSSGSPARAAGSGEPASSPAEAAGEAAGSFGRGPRDVAGYSFTEGTMQDRGFVVDDVLETPEGRTLHVSLHVPDAYDGSVPFALYVACPGWEGLYFQGVGANLQEAFPFVANDYIADMIVATPQLDGWDEQSARDTIALTEWLFAAFNVDASRVYLSGCSGGGETVSYVLGLQPGLYRRALHVISQWDGDLDALADSRVPVYMAIGEHDDYYGAEPVSEAFDRLCDAYRRRGVPEDRIAELAVLDVKPTNYFTERGLAEDASQHAGGGALFPHDDAIMGWFFR